jgi:hypothetical protein
LLVRSLARLALLGGSFALVACSVRLPPSSEPLPTRASSSTAPSPTGGPISTPSRPVPTEPGEPPVWFPPEPEAEPRPPEGALALDATVEQDGIRLTIALERNPMPAGEPTWMATEVRNVGDDDLFYADPCTLVPTGGVLEGQLWRPGLEWPGEVGALKQRAMERLLLADDAITVGFAPEWAVERDIPLEEVGCDAMLVVKRLEPGAALRERARWNGWTVASNAPPPSGPVQLVGTFSFFWRESEGLNPPDRAHERTVAVGLDAWIDGLAEPPLVHPGEAIDIALAHPAFGPALLERPRFEGWYLTYLIDDHAWLLGRRDPPHDPEFVGTIDALDGTLTGITWNP